MNWQRDKAIIISGGTSVVLAGVAIFLILKFGGEFKQAKQDLESAEGQIRQMTSSEIFPNAENLKVLQDNSTGLETFKESQLARLRDRQFKPLEMTPTDFIDDVKARFTALRASSLAVLEAAAERDKVGDEALKVKSALTDEFFGGFERYGFEGFPPAEIHVPRLTIQLQTVDDLVKILVRNEVSEVLSVTRTKFDAATAVAPARPDPDAEPEALPLYEAEYYELIFLAREDVTWKILQDLANANSLYAVTRASFQNENKGMQTDMTINVGTPGRSTSGGGSLAALLGGSPAAQKKTEGATRPGKELVRTKLNIKVTGFPAPPAPEEPGEESSEEEER